MSKLLIIVALLAIGKIHGRDPVASQVSNPRYSPVPAFDRRPVPRWAYAYSELRTPQPPRLYTNAPRPADRESSQIHDRSDDLNLPPPTMREDQIRRNLFVSNNMSGNINNTVTSNDILRQNNGDKVSSNKKNITIPVSTQSVNVNSVNVSTVKSLPVNENDIMPAVVSLGERSSFKGDECPVGFARVKGQCVKAD